LVGDGGEAYFQSIVNLIYFANNVIAKKNEEIFMLQNEKARLETIVLDQNKVIEELTDDRINKERVKINEIKKLNL
jgi:hypothetical protein